MIYPVSQGLNTVSMNFAFLNLVIQAKKLFTTNKNNVLDATGSLFIYKKAGKSLLRIQQCHPKRAT